MNREEIYVSMEVVDHEVRPVADEFYGTRFNILRAEKVPIQGIEKQRITDEQNVVGGITKAKEQAEDAPGYHIRWVLAAIPSVNVQRHNKKVNVVPEASSKHICLSGIRKGLNEVVSLKPDPWLELVNIDCAEYITNSITSRKMPTDETAEVLVMNVDLLYADKEVVYAYARYIERAGLKILDVCLDPHAMAGEAVVFEQTVDKYVIQIGLARDHTTLSLFTRDKLVNCEIIEDGYGVWLQDLIEQCRLNNNVSHRLAQSTCTSDADSAKDQIIYIWSKSGEQR